MKRNAFFQLVHKDDGMYLKSYPPVDGGSPLSIEDVMRYLELKKFDDVLLENIKEFIDRSSQERNVSVKIQNKDIIPEKELLVVTVDPKRLYAKVRLYPNSSKGSRLSKKDIMSLLEQNKVVHGIIEKNVDMMIRARLYCTDILVAKATLPIHGSDAVITYHFNVDKTNKPTMSENGQVDYHNLDMIEPVKDGQHLATLVPADLGTPGTDVCGGVLKPRKVSILALKHGKNIHLSEDGLEMYSDVSGNVTLVEGTVFVSDCYEVPADVGPSTGDIHYDGSVQVKGNVLTGYTIEASGDIQVNGAVEGATLISGGKIVLSRGIQGKERGVMKAAGDIISNFIESSTVTAGGKIITDAIMHSTVIAKDSIEVNGKRGLIAGGSIRSTQKVETKIAGSTMGTTTEIEVGFDPDMINRYHEIEKKVEEMGEEKDIIIQTVETLKKRFKLQGSLEPEKLEILKNSKARLEEIDSEMESLTEEYDAIEEEMQESKSVGKIIVHDTAYSGVKITISNVVKYLHSEVQHSTFVREGADIRIKGI